MKTITVELNVKRSGNGSNDPVQMQLVVVPADEVEYLKKQVQVLMLQNSQNERQLNSLRERFYELVELFGDFRKGRL